MTNDFMHEALEVADSFNAYERWGDSHLLRLMLEPILEKANGGQSLPLNDAARAVLFMNYRSLRFTSGGEEEFLKLFNSITPLPTRFTRNEEIEVPVLGDRDSWRLFASSFNAYERWGEHLNKILLPVCDLIRRESAIPTAVGVDSVRAFFFVEWRAAHHDGYGTQFEDAQKLVAEYFERKATSPQELDS